MDFQFISAPFFIIVMGSLIVVTRAVKTSFRFILNPQLTCFLKMLFICKNVFVFFALYTLDKESLA